MEEKKEKKSIKCSYAVLVIILFAALAFVADYAFIERKMNKCDCPKCEATNNEVISDNTDNTQVTENKTYTYENISGVYEMKYDGSITKTNTEIKAYIRLSLLRNGTYIYSFVDGPGEGELLGNYIIDGDTILLNNQFERYHDGGSFGVFIISKSFKIESLDKIYSESGLKNYNNELLMYRNNDKTVDEERYINIIKNYKLKNDVSD